MVKHIHIQYSLFAACVWCYALRRIVFFIPYFCHKSNSLKLCISTTHFHLYESFALAVIKLPQIHLNTQSHIILYLPFSVSTVTKNSIESTVEQKKKKKMIKDIIAINWVRNDVAVIHQAAVFLVSLVWLWIKHKNRGWRKKGPFIYVIWKDL